MHWIIEWVVMDIGPLYMIGVFVLYIYHCKYKQALISLYAFKQVAGRHLLPTPVPACM